MVNKWASVSRPVTLAVLTIACLAGGVETAARPRIQVSEQTGPVYGADRLRGFSVADFKLFERSDELEKRLKAGGWQGSFLQWPPRDAGKAINAFMLMEDTNNVWEKDDLEITFFRVPDETGRTQVYAIHFRQAFKGTQDVATLRDRIYARYGKPTRVSIDNLKSTPSNHHFAFAYEPEYLGTRWNEFKESNCKRARGLPHLKSAECADDHPPRRDWLKGPPRTSMQVEITPTMISIRLADEERARQMAEKAFAAIRSQGQQQARRETDKVDLKF